ncbi:MAG: phosphoribosylaminoimidazolesuccinocarboxamide synthase [Verrucomicrobiae bacterium]|jgi:phosphoribosylaminoimidazole-succinocarboxamide synthase|nr:phosphoribosylaminoimidazolesuccinocarboxamide synthase [Verrucomicrobiae bacterium]
MELLNCELPPLQKLRSGKVREVFDLAPIGLREELLLVATDRLSAFDCILPNAIPGKGVVLNQLSTFWFQKLSFVPNHLIETEVENYPEALAPYAELLQGRSMIVKKTAPLPVECVVRGYLAGSGWHEYQSQGTLAGIPLPAGLQQAERLATPHFTPSTKAEEGHDEPITWEACQQLLGKEIAEQVRSMSIALYEAGSKFALEQGIIIADTKFEFGLLGDQVILIDECMTPDSSRFWPIDQYEIGKNPPSFDKQFARDYLETSGWNKLPPAPTLPEEIIIKTAQKYQEALERFTKN